MKEVGKVYRTQGLDMNCFPVEVKAKLVEILPKEKVRRYENKLEGGELVLDCIVESDGCRSFSTLSKLY